MKTLRLSLILLGFIAFFSGCMSDTELDELVNKKEHLKKSQSNTDDDEDDQD